MPSHEVGLMTGSTSMARIEARPKKALVDVALKIKILGLKEGESVTIRSKLLSEKKIPFYCIAHYVADSNGAVCLNKDASVGGYYTGIEPMGLIWAMRVSPKYERRFIRLEKRDVTTPFIVEFAVLGSHIGCVEDTFDEEPIAVNDVERWYMSENVTRICVKDLGFKGTLFLPEGEGVYPGIIDLFGGKSGITEFRASLLASHGYTTLTLAYCNFPSTLLNGLDMELFEEAAKFLSNHPKVKPGGIGIIGVSLGGTVSLFMASYFPDLIRCTVSINGALFANLTELRYKGRSWAGIFYDQRKASVSNNALKVAGGLEYACFDNLGSSRIDLQRAKANILFVVSEDDCCLYSRDQISMINSVMKGKTNYQVLVNCGAGHLVEPSFSPFFRQTAINPEYQQLWGGNAKDHARAQEKTWTTTLVFLWENLVDNSNYSSLKSSL